VLRSVAVAGALAVAVALGAVQLASSAAYGDLADRPSVPAALHAAAPGLLRPLLGGPRAQAAAALHDGDLATAGRLIAALPAGPGAAELRGQLAQAQGDRASALAAYVAAGDVVRAQDLIDTVAADDPAAALPDQQRLVARLGTGVVDADGTGQAWWRLGQLQAESGYRHPEQRAEAWRAAELSYERALAFAPNEETYLLAAGYQSLANGDVAAASRFYRRAAEVVPDSADAYGGLAWTSAAAGDCAAARAALLRSRALRSSPGRDPVDDPLAGAALRRCGP
jgi:tetratricopeptide (TPR) repeat protein